MGFRRDESGQMLVLTALSMVALMGFMALAVDVGLLFRAKRNVQTAADAGAIAAALEYWYNGPTNMGSVTATAVGANGVQLSYTPSVNAACPSTTQNCAIVNLNPNITSPYHAQPGYVQVLVAQPNPTFFSSLFLSGKVNVSASAIAGIAPNPACILTLSQTDAKSFWIKGNSSIYLGNCGVHVDSGSSSAVCVQGSASIDGPYVQVNGQQSSAGQCNKSPGAPVYGNSGIQNDPFGNLLGPNPLGLRGTTADTSCQGTNTYVDPLGTNTLDGSNATELAAFQALVAQPAASGVASDAVICFTNNVTIRNMTGSSAMGPALYLFENGVNISNNVVVSGGTLDIYNGTFTNQNGNLNITAPANKSATYNAIAIMQPWYNQIATCQDNSLKAVPCLQVQFGSGNVGTATTCDPSLQEDLCGYIYAPTSTVYLQDEGGGVTASGVIANNFYNNSQLTIVNNYNFVNPSTTPLATVALVE